jgi:hypothetical protein
MRRYFSLVDGDRAKAWTQNGRLFGGFWLNLERSRRSNIRIEGERVADLDYASMFARLAYAHMGGDPAPQGDLYDLTGLLRGYDKEKHRDAVKQGFNSLLNGGRAGSREILKGLPPKTTAVQLRDAVLRKHPGLAQAIAGKPIGLELMFTESRILLGCLKRLMGSRIVALPIHDGLMVGKSKMDEARRVMEEVSNDHLGFPLPVSCEFLGYQAAARGPNDDGKEKAEALLPDHANSSLQRAVIGRIKTPMETLLRLLHERRQRLWEAQSRSSKPQ